MGVKATSNTDQNLRTLVGPLTSYLSKSLACATPPRKPDDILESHEGLEPLAAGCCVE